LLKALELDLESMIQSSVSINEVFIILSVQKVKIYQKPREYQPFTWARYRHIFNHISNKKVSVMPEAKWENKDKLEHDHKDDPVYRLHSHFLDLQHNHVFLFPRDDLAATETYGDAEPGVEYTMANRFIMNARLCMMANPGAPMVVHQKTCGGDWNEGIAIFDMLITYPHETTILNYTHARSMSSMTFQAATKRVMMPHSHFMFHDGEYGDMGTVKQVRSGFQFSEKTDGVMMDIYARRMKQQGKYKSWSYKRINEMMRDLMDKKEDVYLTAKETVEWGLADEIFNGSWADLSKYTSEQISRGNEYAAYFLK
jgi:ATP-dependent protease ClpP protease subunit